MADKGQLTTSGGDELARRTADDFDAFYEEIGGAAAVLLSRQTNFMINLNALQEKLDAWIRLLLLRHSAYRIRAATNSKDFDKFFEGLDLSRAMDPWLFFEDGEFEFIDDQLAEPGTDAAYAQICTFLKRSEDLAEERMTIQNQIADYLARETLKLEPLCQELENAENRERIEQGLSPRAGGERTVQPRGDKRRRNASRREFSEALRTYLEDFASKYSGTPLTKVVEITSDKKSNMDIDSEPRDGQLSASPSGSIIDE